MKSLKSRLKDVKDSLENVNWLMLKFKRISPFPQKKVLVIEGGGMRGIFLTGVLQAFTDRAYFPWELIIGSSAGALTGTAYAAGQIHLALDAFFTELLTGNFINISNIVRTEKHILNLDWMIDTIIKGDEPLNIRRLKKSCPVLITATHCRQTQPPETVYLNTKKDNVPTALKATAAIPFLYRNFVKYKHYKFLDGALLDPIPYKKALEMGYNEEDILVITTHKKGYRKKRESFWIKKLYESYYKNPRHKFLLKALDRFQEYNKIRDDLERKNNKIDVIYPPDDFRVNRLSQDGERILEGFEQGIKVAKEWLYKDKKKKKKKKKS
jgi:predicted patatin/cPLA2 family phospholipase